MTTISPPKGADRPVLEPRGGRQPGRFRTTPGRLRLLSIVSVGAVVVLLIVSAGALSSRRGAANSVRNDSGALLGKVQAMYHALADADASASQGLLAPGQQSADLLQRYQRDMDEAARLLSDIASKVESSPEAARAVHVIAARLPEYTARIRAGQVYTSFGQPLGPEYTRQGSKLMRTEILDKTLDLYAIAADELHDDYERGTSASQMVWIVVIGLVTIAVLVATQLFAARRTNRVLNVALLAASLIVAVLLVWTLVRFENEQDALVTAQRNGSDSVQVLTAARVLALKAAANSNLALAERGTGQEYRNESERVMTKLCGGSDRCDGGLLAYVHGVAARTRDQSRVTAIQDDAARLRTLITEVGTKDDGGEYAAAVNQAIVDQAAASGQLDDAIAGASDDAQARFDAAARDARSGFAVLAIVLTLGLLVAAALVLVGLQPRISEYR